MTTANQPFTHSFNHSIIWAPIPSTTRLANHSTNPSISHPINQSFDQSINRSINLSINQWFKQFFDIHFHWIDTFDVLLHICLLLVCAESSLAMENPGRETYESMRLPATMNLTEATWGYPWQREMLAGRPMRLPAAIWSYLRLSLKTASPGRQTYRAAWSTSDATEAT